MLLFSLILFPFLNFLNISFFGSRLGRLGSIFFSGFFYSFILFISFLNLIVYINFLDFSTVVLSLGNWITSESLIVFWVFSFDSLSNIMLILVCLVSSVVIFYSFDYMHNDPYISKFLSYISLFTFFMVLLVVSANFGVFLVGWEGVGICSFLLISFWNLRSSACKAGLKAIIFNRFGDIGFLIGLSLIFYLIGSVDFFLIYSFLPFFSFSLFTLLFGYPIYMLDLILFFLFFGVIGKSAQIGLHVWLLDAMEGPTPVSALIHAATMVTAGVFLLIRLSFILEYALFVRTFIVIIGSFTMLAASVIGSLQNDLKSIIAYSTCSQLGYMVSVCGLSGYSIAFFHLINHGFFKALLFLSSGVIIHNFLDEQDIRKMGGLFFIFPITFIFFVISSLSLTGFPFFSGYFSKDFLLEYSYILPFTFSSLVFHLGIISALFTVYYSFRLLFFCFICKPNGLRINYIFSFESYSFLMITGMTILAFLSIFSGFFFKDFFLPGSIFLYDSVFCMSYLIIRQTINVEFFFLQNSSIWFSLKIIPFMLLFVGFMFFYILLNRLNLFYINLLFNFFYFFIYSFIYNGFFFNYFYIKIIGNYIFFNLCWLFFFLDKSFLEFYGPFFFKSLFNNFFFFLNPLSFSYSYYLNFIIYFVYIFLYFFFFYIYMYN